MMNNKLLVLIFLISSSAFAEDCTGMKDNEEKRLDKAGGPLFQSAIQDQDGLATCYANSTSIALKTALPGNPDISYLQLAFSYGQKTSGPENAKIGIDSAYKLDALGNRGEMVFNLGLVCDTINAVKDKVTGGVCQRRDVALETIIFNPETNRSKDPFFVQARVLEAVSSYYDSAKLEFAASPNSAKNEIASRVLAFNRYQKSFDDLIKIKQQSYVDTVCSKPDLSNVENIVKNSIAGIYLFLKNKYGSNTIPAKINEKVNPDIALAKYLSKIGTVKTAGNELIITVNTELLKALEKGYMADLVSASPPADALTALRKTLVNHGKDKTNQEIVDKIIKNFNPEDSERLVSD